MRVEIDVKIVHATHEFVFEWHVRSCARVREIRSVEFVFEWHVRIRVRIRIRVRNRIRIRSRVRIRVRIRARETCRLSHPNLEKRFLASLPCWGS